MSITSPHFMQAHSRTVTGGVYKAQVQVHRAMMMRDYWRFLLHILEFQKIIWTTDFFIDLLRLTPLLLFIKPFVAYLLPDPWGPCWFGVVPAFLNLLNCCFFNVLCYYALVIKNGGCTRYMDLTKSSRHVLTTTMQHLSNLCSLK